VTVRPRRAVHRDVTELVEVIALAVEIEDEHHERWQHAAAPAQAHREQLEQRVGRAGELGAAAPRPRVCVLLAPQMRLAERCAIEQQLFAVDHEAPRHRDARVRRDRGRLADLRRICEIGKQAQLVRCGGPAQLPLDMMTVAFERAERMIVAEPALRDRDRERIARRGERRDREPPVHAERALRVLRIEAREPQLGTRIALIGRFGDEAQPEALPGVRVVPRQVPDFVRAALGIVLAVVELLGHAVLGGSASFGLPITRRLIHDANRRGTSRTLQHDSLLMMPGITVRLRRSIALTEIFATRSALIIDAFAIQP
jgi:hypothetical protein